MSMIRVLTTLHNKHSFCHVFGLARFYVNNGDQIEDPISRSNEVVNMTDINVASISVVVVTARVL